MTLVGLLERAVLRRPEADAVVDGSRRLDYAGLERCTTALGAGFRRLGVGHGGRVLIALRNRLEHVLAYWALQRLGAVPVPVNFRLAAAEIHYLLDDSGAVAALCEAATAPAVAEAAADTTTRLVHVGDQPPPNAVRWEDLLGEEFSGGHPLGTDPVRGEGPGPERPAPGEAGVSATCP